MVMSSASQLENNRESPTKEWTLCRIRAKSHFRRWMKGIMKTELGILLVATLCIGCVATSQRSPISIDEEQICSIVTHAISEKYDVAVTNLHVIYLGWSINPESPEINDAPLSAVVREQRYLLTNGVKTRYLWEYNVVMDQNCGVLEVDGQSQGPWPERTSNKSMDRTSQ